ncbi:MAG: glyceraldehyde-3-phosphate dehydrogenase [Shimia sp.]
MTNRLAIIFAVLIIGAILADVILNGSEASLFLLRKMMDLIDWMAFWR